MFASDRDNDKETKENLTLLLARFEMDYSQGLLPLEAMEDLLLNADIRSILNKKDSLSSKFYSLYGKYLIAFTNQLTEICRTLYNRIPASEFKYMLRPDEEKSPNLALFVENHHSLTLFIQTDILRHKSVTKGTLAIQRWLAIALQACSQGDYETAYNIYGTMDSIPVSRYRQHLTNLIGDEKYLQTLFHHNDLHITARELVMGQTIPMFPIFSKIVFTSLEASKDHSIKKNEVFHTVRDILLDLQESNAPLVDTSISKTDKTVVASREELRKELIDIHKALPSPEAQARNPSTMLQDNLLYYISKEHTEDFSLGMTHIEANLLLEKILKKIPFLVPASLVLYREALNEIRELTSNKIKDKRGMLVINTNMDEREAARRLRIRGFLRELSQISNINKKASMLDIQMRTDSARKKDHPDIICDPSLYKLFEKLLASLNMRENEEREKIAQVRRQREAKKQDKTRSESAGVHFAIETPLNRYILSRKISSREMIPLLPLKSLEKTTERDIRFLDVPPSSQQDQITLSPPAVLSRQSSTSSVHSTVSADKLFPSGTQVISAPSTPNNVTKGRMSPKYTPSLLLRARTSSSGSLLDGTQMPSSPSEMRSQQHSPYPMRDESSTPVSLQNSPHLRDDSSPQLAVVETMAAPESPTTVKLLPRPNDRATTTPSPRRNTVGDLRELRQSGSGIRIADNPLSLLSKMGRSRALKESLQSSTDCMPPSAEEKPLTPGTP